MLQVQYFVAGLPVIALLLVWIVSLGAVLKLTNRALSWARSRPPAISAAVSLTGGAVGVACIHLYPSWRAVSAGADEAKNEGALLALAFAYIAIHYVLYMVIATAIGGSLVAVVRKVDRHQPKRRQTGSADFEGGVKVFNFSALTVVMLAIGQIYVNVVHPYLPQAIGGARPRCTQFDVQRAQLASTTLNAIGIEAGDGDAVARLRPVAVVFSGSDLYLLNVSGPDGGKAKVLELRKGVVQAVEWCD